MDRQTRQEYSAEVAFNLVGALFFSCMKIKFGHGVNSRYGPWNMFCHLATMCMRGSCAEKAYQTAKARSRSMALPSGRWLLGKIRSVRYDWMNVRCDETIMRTVRQARRRGMLRRPVNVAIDFHKIGRYDRIKNMLFMVKSKYENGTCTFNSLATAHCTVAGSRLCLAAILATRGDQKAVLVARLLDKCRQNGVGINLLTLDREFYTREVMKLLNDRNIRFLMPAARTGSVVGAIREHQAGRRAAVSWHTIISSSPRKVEGFTLVIRPAKSARDAAEVETGEKSGDTTIRGDRPAHHVFATSIPAYVIAGDPDRFVELYRQRWGIETGYRCYEEIRPRTTSRHESVRILLMFFPFLLYNAWVIAGHLLERRYGSRYRQGLTITLLVTLFVDFSGQSALMERPPDSG